MATATVGCAGAIAATPALTKDSIIPASHYPWVILYWMPYENDLSRFGERIVEMLARGTRTSNVAVAVQSDYLGDAAMRRRQIVNGNIRESDVTGEDSSDVSAFADFLDWAYQTFAARHWAIVVVGHGGKISEISPDNHSTTHQDRTWMSVNELTSAVASFNQRANEQVELLFFQNCNKATLEVVYEARHCARYTLASQLALGAPNYYYEGFLDRLQNISNGREAAIALMHSERVDMYYTLTLVDNQAVALIPEKLSQLLKPVIIGELPMPTQTNPSTYWYFGERHCDLLSFLNALLMGSSQHERQLAEFTEFLRSRVINHHKTGGELYAAYRSINWPEPLCGLGLYFPEDNPAASRYSTLALYQEADLIALYRRILGYLSWLKPVKHDLLPVTNQD